MSQAKIYCLLFILIGIAKTSFSQTYIHTVTDRDDIYRIARIYNLSPEVLANINGLESVHTKLLQNQKLIIPDTNYKPVYRGDKNLKLIKHRIERNESLSSIARLYGIMVFDILELNPSIDRDMDRNQFLLEGDELRIPSSKSRSQFTHYYVYLNGDKIHYLADESRSEAEKKEVERLNSKIAERVNAMYKVQEPIITKFESDSFQIPHDDHTVMSRLIYNLIKYYAYPEYTKKRWLDSLYEEIYIVRSEIKKKENLSDPRFIAMAQNVLYQINQANPNNDYIYALRSMIYYWLGNHARARVYSDEALLYNAQNTSALIMKAVFLLEENHLDKAVIQLTSLINQNPSSHVLKYNLATANYFKLDFTKAIYQYNELLNKLPNYSAEMNYRIGHSYILSGNDDHGCEYILKANAKNYPNADVLKMRNCK